MNHPSGDHLWEHAVAAARRKNTGPVAPASPESPPPGFAARLAVRWADLRQNELFRLWCRWSLRAALAGLIVAGIVALAFPPSDSAAPLRAPDVEVPTFPAP